MVGELPQVYSQHLLIGIGSGFSGELYSEYWWCVNQRTQHCGLVLSHNGRECAILPVNPLSSKAHTPPIEP